LAEPHHPHFPHYIVQAKAAVLPSGISDQQAD
jgi:hypothetical protein